ncbi:MAG: hypothetical protein ABIZ91_17015 [Gemmatimonadaceae bacterium]
MQSDPGLLAILRERYRFAEWSEGTGGAKDPLRVTPLRGTELPGWRLERGSTSTPRPGVSLVRGMWLSLAGNDRLMDLELFECDSASAARLLLLELLGDMQGPPANRLPPDALGDVAFNVGADLTIMFVRANVAVRLRNAGRNTTGLTAEAGAIDALLSAGDAAR